MEEYFRVDKNQKGIEYNGMLFWKAEGKGYTEDIGEAGKFIDKLENSDTISIKINDISIHDTKLIISYKHLKKFL